MPKRNIVLRVGMEKGFVHDCDHDKYLLENCCFKVTFMKKLKNCPSCILLNVCFNVNVDVLRGMLLKSLGNN